MEKQSIQLVNKQINLWETSYSKNNERGRKFVKFAIGGDQWDAGVPKRRADANKESLVFNLCIKYLKRMKAQSKEIEFTIDISPISDEAQENVEESNAYRLLMQSIMLSDNKMNTLSAALDKCIEYGYSFIEVNYERENADTLNCIPVLRLHKDPSIAFWDSNSQHPQKIDGRYCGLKRRVSKSDVFKKYPSLKDNPKIKEQDNILIDYWYRDYKDEVFVLLKTGVYKRKDMLTMDDKNNLMQSTDLRAVEDGVEIPLEKKAPCCKIYFKRFLNDMEIEKAIEFPTDDLPLIYWDPLTYWHPEDGDFTTPLVYHLEGAQKLHNYVNSQLATQAKNVSADKWLFSDEHATNPTQISNAQNISKKEGGMIFGGNIQTIRREVGGQLSDSMINLAQVIKQEIDEISGAMIDSKNPQQTVVSGEALDKITKNMNAVNMDILAKNIICVNTVGLLIKQMIPKIITEERTLVIKKQDGSGQALTINKVLPTGDIINNIKDINNNYYWEIKSSPNSTMQRENTVRYLAQLYTVNPQLFSTTGDIFARCLQTPYAGELERRFAASMDKSLIQYSQGEITEEQFQQAQQQKQMQQQQQQQQQANLDPQFRSAQALAAAEHKKADAQLMDSHTKQMDSINKAQQAQDNLKIQMVNAFIKANDNEASQFLESMRNSLQANQQMIDNMRIEMDRQNNQQNSQMNGQQNNQMSGQ